MIRPFILMPVRCLYQTTAATAGQYGISQATVLWLLHLCHHRVSLNVTKARFQCLKVQCIKIISTEGTKFTLSQHTGRDWVCGGGGGFAYAYVLKNNGLGGGSFMTWEGIMTNRKTCTLFQSTFMQRLILIKCWDNYHLFYQRALSHLLNLIKPIWDALDRRLRMRHDVSNLHELCTDQFEWNNMLS